MTDYNYEFCGVGVRVRTQKPLAVTGDSARFPARLGPVKLTVDCLARDCVSIGAGTLLRREQELMLLRSGTALSRCRMTQPDAAPHVRLDYDLDAPGRAVLTVREEDWPWATDHLRLWANLCLPQLLLPFRTLIFHASYIGCEGGGLLFTAPSGTGKSTQAELWRVHRGAEIINGDKAGVTLREQPMAHGVPFSGTSGICENVSLPLKAIVALSQAPENSVRRLGPSEAAAALCPNLFADQAVAEEWQTALNLLLDLVASVPVFALACTPDERAVECLERALNL